MTRPANPWWKRMQRQWRQWRGFEQAKTHQVEWVLIGGQKAKRVTFKTKREADVVATALKTLAPLGCFPTLIAHQDQCVWVSFVPEQATDEDPSDLMSAFFQRLYDHQFETPIDEVSSDTALEKFESHLNALRASGQFDDAFLNQLSQQCLQCQPQTVYVGLDYVDAIAKNFVMSNGRAIGIDIDAIEDNVPLGKGLAKADYRALINTPELMGTLDARLVRQYPFVRFCFAAEYFCQKLAQGKKRHIDPSVVQAWF